MAPGFQRLRVLRSVLIAQITELTTKGYIRPEDAPDLSNVSSLELFYIVTAHASTYHRKIEALVAASPNFKTKKEFFVRYHRMADFMQRIHERPPVREHLTLINAIVTNHASIMAYSSQQVEHALEQLREYLQSYMESISQLAIDKTESQHAMDRYFENDRNFYLPKSSPKYSTEYEKSRHFKAHQDALATLFYNMNMNHQTTRLYDEIIGRINMQALFDFETLELEDFVFPIVSNFLPPTASAQYSATSIRAKRILKTASDETDLDNERDSRPANPYTDIVTSTAFEHIRTESTAPSTPFPHEFYEHPEGLPNDPKDPKGKGKKKKGPKSTTGNSPDDSDSGPSGSASSKVPNDDSYEPDALLFRLAMDITEFVRILPDTDMTYDHMTRFSTTFESPQAISRDSLRDTDQRVVSRDRYGSHTYLVTYTRKSRKPIFSPVN